LSVAAGMAYTGKNFDKADYRVYCLIGDGESAEGSIWEAMSFSGHYKLDNLVAIFDINRLGQSEPTAFQHDLELYRSRAESFGFRAVIVDGHNVEELVKAFDDAKNHKGQPTALICKTFKGRDFVGIEDQDNWHGKALGASSSAVVKDLKNRLTSQGPYKTQHSEDLGPVPAVDLCNIKLATPPQYKLGELVATRLAYGTALAKLGHGNNRSPWTVTPRTLLLLTSSRKNFQRDSSSVSSPSRT